MTLWICKAGDRGQREERMLEKSVLGIGWGALGDLSKIDSRDELKSLYSKTYPDASRRRMGNHVGQILSFIKKTKIGDTVVTPLKLKTRRIAVGEVIGGYEFREDLGTDMKHIIPVKWIKTDIPRTMFDQDLLYSFGAFMTFCQARTLDAEVRVMAVAAGVVLDVEREDEDDILRDIEDESLNQINDYISIKFKGHAHADLIASILKSQGYETKTASPGPDGGVDITASKGSLGLLEPRICVQVKSGGAVGGDVYDRLKGRMASLNATHGLLVSWGGFKPSVKKAAVNDAFLIKLWGPKEIVDQLFEVYPKIEPELRVRLPLKRIWILSTPEE